MPRAHSIVIVRPSTLVVALAAGALLLGIVAGPALAVGGSEFVAIATKAYTLASSSSASATTRAVFLGRSGTWYLIGNGVWASYWMQASSGVVLH